MFFLIFFRSNVPLRTCLSFTRSVTGVTFFLFTGDKIHIFLPVRLLILNSHATCFSLFFFRSKVPLRTCLSFTRSVTGTTFFLFNGDKIHIFRSVRLLILNNHATCLPYFWQLFKSKAPLRIVLHSLSHGYNIFFYLLEIKSIFFYLSVFLY